MITNGFRFRVGMSLVLGLICGNAAVADGPLFPDAQYPAGHGPWSVAIGDLDGDQVPDLAVANLESYNVSVLLGLGDGTFAAAVDYAADWEPSSVAIGDLDGDQVPDLAVANGGSDNVSVLLGVGDGTFADAVDYAAGNEPTSVAIGDLNGDQAPDLAVANTGDPPYSIDNVSVLLGLGDGTFAAAVDYAAGWGPTSVAIGDLNGDQVPDLAVANYHSNNVSVLLNQSGWRLGDLNCDGAIDDFDIDPFVVALTDPDGYAAAYPDCNRMLADCNGDGLVDAFDIDPFVELLIGP